MSDGTKPNPIGYLLMLAGAALIASVPTMVLVQCCGGINYEFSDGSRSGVVQKISKRGMVWKTWEGELNLGYSRSVSNGNGGSSIVPAIWYFSTSDESVAQKLIDCERSGERVTLHYKDYLLRGYKYGDTSYDVHAVDASGDSKD